MSSRCWSTTGNAGELAEIDGAEAAVGQHEPGRLAVIRIGVRSLVLLRHLTWNGELDLMCPTNRIGTVDLYLTSHHGGAPGPGSGRGPGGPGAAAHLPAYLITVSAQQDGSFTVTNTRNGFSKTYPPRP